LIVDTFNEFGDNKALNTGAAGSYLVGNVIDTLPNAAGAGGNITSGLGVGRDLWLVIQVTTTATSGGSATAQWSLCSDAQAAIAVDGSQTTHFSTAAIAVATLVAGYRVCCIRLPAGTYERYVGIVQTTAVAAFTAGKVDMFLTDTPNLWTAYNDAV
jgi:hypothetical protein